MKEGRKLKLPTFSDRRLPARSAIDYASGDLAVRAVGIVPPTIGMSVSVGGTRMQDSIEPNSATITKVVETLSPAAVAKIVATLSPERLGRYHRAAGTGDLAMALRMYVWNGRICEAFVIPSQIAEVAVRNAIAARVAYIFRSTPAKWHVNNGPLHNILSGKGKGILEEANKNAASEHGQAATVNHTIANLSFGFWVNLTNARYHRRLWSAGIQHNFCNAPAGKNIADLNLKLQAAKEWRNRLAHHGAIFDKDPSSQLNNLLDLIGWVCPHTRAFATQVSRVGATLAERPAA